MRYTPLQNIPLKTVHIINGDYDDNDYRDVALFVIHLKRMMDIVNLEHAQEKYSFLLKNRFA